ncbi:ferrioxamine B transporter [Rhodotorula kratochvilovae]
MSAPFAAPGVAHVLDDVQSSDDKRSLSEVAEEQPTAGQINHSLGVKRIEAINSQLTPFWRGWLWASVFLLSYCYSLDATVRGTLQSYATSSFEQHSLLSTVNVLKSIIAAASYPPYAQLANTFGRVEVILFSVVMYVVGTIVEACAKNLSTFCAGAVLFQFGYSAAILMMELVISDLTSLRSRLLFSYIPALPFLINCWASANVVSAITANTTWQVGIGVWAAVYPFCALLVIVPFVVATRKAKRAGLLDDYLTPYQQLGAKRLASYLFWEIDVVGAILVIAILALILLPFTLAGGVAQSWKAAHNIAMLVIGVVVALPAFIIWERKFARVPLFPFHLMKTRTVIGCLGIAVMLNFTWYMQGAYLYTALVVAFHESVLSATRITSMYSFASVITGTLAGFFVRFVLRRLKPVILAGISIYLIAFGLLIHYRGGESAHDGIVAAEVVLGIAGGLFPYSAQALIQTEGGHQHTSILLASYLAVYNIGSSLGSSVSGAIWTQVLPAQLEKAIPGNATAVQFWYGSPFEAITTPEGQWGMPVRMAVVEAYKHVQKLLCIAAVLLVVCGLILRDPILGKEQSLPNAEEQSKAAMAHKVVA